MERSAYSKCRNCGKLALLIQFVSLAFGIYKCEECCHKFVDRT